MPTLLLLMTLAFSHTIAPIPPANTITIKSNGHTPSGSACVVTVWAGFVSGAGKAYPLSGQKFNVIRVSPAGSPIAGITGGNGTKILEIPAGTTVRASLVGGNVVSKDLVCHKLAGSDRERVGVLKEQ